MTIFSRDDLTFSPPTVRSISCDDLRNAQETNSAPLVIDVRELEEWDAGHITGAIHIPRGILEFKISEIAPNRDTPIVLYCRSGGRATTSAHQLLTMGYANISNLEGGYLAYQNTQ